MAFSLGESLGRRNISRFSLFCLAALLVALPGGGVSAWTWERDARWFYLFLISFFASTILVPVSIYLSIKFLVLDMPNERKVHSAATPRLGGLAVFGATMLTLFRNYQFSPQLLGLAAGGAIIYIMGVWEDARGLSARFRLFGQLAASLVCVYSGVSVTFFPDYIWGERLWETLFSVVWFVGITNAINFLDGIDGLAAGMGTVCSLLFLSIAWPDSQSHLAYFSAALAGACLGFIPYNWHNAKLFLGDGGSTFIGFTLAGLAVMGGWATNNPLVALSTPIMILGIPIFDMTYTTISRVRRGAVKTVKEWIEFTGKDHFHHRLMKLGLGVPESVGFILLVNICIGLGALVIRYTHSSLGSVLLLAQTFLIFMVIVVLMLLGREISESAEKK